MANKFGKSGSPLMYCFAAILFFVASLVDKNLIYAPIGMIFLILGMRAGRKEKKK